MSGKWLTSRWRIRFGRLFARGAVAPAEAPTAAPAETSLVPGPGSGTPPPESSPAEEPEPQPASEPAARRPRWRQLGAALEQLRKLVVDLLIVLLAALVIGLMAAELGRRVLIVEPFSVPEELATAQGLTGEVLATRLIDEIECVRRQARVSATATSDISLAWLDEEADVKAAVGGITVGSVLQALRGLLGHSKRILGEVTLEGGELQLRVRVVGSASRTFAFVEGEMGPVEELGGAGGCQQVLRRELVAAAEYVLEVLEPFLPAAALYVRSSKLDPEERQRCFRLVRRCLTNDAPQDDAPAQNLWGLILLRERRWEEAKLWLRQAIAADRDFVLAYNNLGLVYLKEGQPEQAERWFREAIRREPEYGSPYTNLGRLLCDRGVEDEGLSLLRQGARLDPLSGLAHRHVGHTLMEMGDYRGAVESLTRAAVLDPESAQTLLYLGDAWRQLGNPDLGMGKYQEALERNLHQARAHLSFQDLIQACCGRAKRFAKQPLEIFELCLGPEERGGSDELDQCYEELVALAGAP